MFEVFSRAKRHLREDGVVLVRCGAKKRTAETCEEAIRAAWPSRSIIVRRTQVTRRGVASGYGHGAKVVEEMDIVATPRGTETIAHSWASGAASFAGVPS